MHHPTSAPAAGQPAPLPAHPARAAGAVAATAVGGAALGAALALDVVPASAAPRLVALAIAAAGGVLALRWVRRGVRRQLREGAAAKVAEFGGGVYGALAFATLLCIEAMDLAADVAGVGSLGASVDSLSLGWLMAQAMGSIGFAIRAGLWPWYWFRELGPAVAALVAGGVWALHGAAPGLGERVAEWRAARRAGVAVSEENP